MAAGLDLIAVQSQDKLRHAMEERIQLARDLFATKSDVQALKEENEGLRVELTKLLDLADAGREGARAGGGGGGGQEEGNRKGAPGLETGGSGIMLRLRSALAGVAGGRAALLERGGWGSVSSGGSVDHDGGGGGGGGGEGTRSLSSGQQEGAEQRPLLTPITEGGDGGNSPSPSPPAMRTPSRAGSSAKLVGVLQRYGVI